MDSLKAEVAATRTTLMGVTTELTDMKIFLKESDKMRRLEFALAHAESVPVCELDSDKQIDSNRVRRIDSDGRLVERYDCEKFIMSTLRKFRRGFGIYLPTDIAYVTEDTAYERSFHCVPSAERGSRFLEFQNVVEHHLTILLGSKPRISKEGNRTAIFYE